MPTAALARRHEKAPRVGDFAVDTPIGKALGFHQQIGGGGPIPGNWRTAVRASPTVLRPDDVAMYPPEGLASILDGRHWWFVVHTMSRQEKALALDCQRLGFGWYLPLGEYVRWCGRKRYVAREPLFPGYLFVTGGDNAQGAIIGTGRACRNINVPEAAQPTLKRQLADLDRALQINPALQAANVVVQGATCEVNSGPLMGLKGTVVSVRNGKATITLPVDVIGGQAILEIDERMLEPVAA
jgi:transcription antitermination factor NusG